MTNGNEPIGSIGITRKDGTTNTQSFGLTKREHFAAMAMQGLLASVYISQFESVGLTKASVRIADELIEALNNPQS